MIYVGRVPAWENRTQQAHAWHCAKCSIEIQVPVLADDLKPLPQTNHNPATP
jgi:hypothetical protein